MVEDVSQWSGTHLFLRRVREARFVLGSAEEGRRQDRPVRWVGASRASLQEQRCVWTQHAGGVKVWTFVYYSPLSHSRRYPQTTSDNVNEMTVIDW